MHLPSLSPSFERSKADTNTNLSTKSSLESLHSQHVPTQESTKDADSARRALRPSSEAASSHRAALPASFCDNSKTSGKDKGKCKNQGETPCICQHILTIWKQEILDDLETHITELFKQDKGARVTARNVFKQMEIFKQIGRDALCEECAVQELETIMDDPRKWYKPTNREGEGEEDEGHAGSGNTTKVHLSEEDSLVSSHSNIGREINPDSMSEHAAKTREQDQVDGVSKIDEAIQFPEPAGTVRKMLRNCFGAMKGRKGLVTGDAV